MEGGHDRSQWPPDTGLTGQVRFDPRLWGQLGWVAGVGALLAGEAKALRPESRAVPPVDLGVP